jgi:hypothetical protein
MREHAAFQLSRSGIVKRRTRSRLKLISMGREASERPGTTREDMRVGGADEFDLAVEGP